jgi:hypothetical protein
MSAHELSWAEANQRYLAVAVDEVRQALQRHAGASPDDPHPAVSTPPPHPTGPFALDALAAGFALSPFERALVVLCAAVELEASFAALCATASGDVRRAFPTFGLALAALPGAHWSALSPARPLRAWRLVEAAPGEALTRAALHLDERVLHFVAGVSHLDERLHGWVEPVAPPDDIPPSQADVLRRIQSALSGPRTDPLPTIQLIGPAGASKRAVAAAACASLGVELFAARAGDLPSGQAERETFARLWGREAVLASAALLVEAEDSDAAERARVAVVADRLPGLVLVGAREPLPPGRRPALRLEVNRPTTMEQRALWVQHLGPLAEELNGQVDALLSHFDLEEGAIRAVCAQSGGEPAGAGPRLWEACRAQARPRLDDLAQRVPPCAGWHDLVLPDTQKGLLRQVAGQVRQRAKVYDAWGFAESGQRGLGISALFAGVSGTGKTMAAEVLARELRLDLYRIDLSQVVSKYIGETEKNLRRVFDAAEGGGAILLFDEADALFGKRSEVKDSHDRYANIEVSYLLQRMETYRGLAILTTNLKNTLDPAFLRRLRFVITFPFPDQFHREAIWRRIFPALTPTEGLDPALLARLNVAGGNIRNIALQAAFLAAEDAEPVRMRHLLRAARTECAKLDRTVTEAEVAGWA